ncbi:quinone-dependent dihydroorotate dehydrogenase [Candidatus Woesearchaeota archaeon]|nr:quinone-dependent dihydroorotate dehydrogenase [Candidatus Woesearchaeota archaeon]
MLFTSIIKPILFTQDPETVHDRVSRVMSYAGKNILLRNLTETLFDYQHPMLPTTFAGMNFRNPLGLAAGFDKQCKLIEITSSLGFGHIEVGCITAKEQEGNPKPRVFRLPSDYALLNRMGFNNKGADKALTQLKQVTSRDIPVGLNIGKSKVTPLDEAHKDYLSTFKTLYDYVDFVTINVSSPNTPGLRGLQDKDQLLKIIKTLQHENHAEKPLLVKIAPDLAFEQIADIIHVAKKTKLSGIIAVNTTLSRENLRTTFHEAGGVSGLPLQQRSTEIINYIYTATSGFLPIIGVGGIFTAKDAYTKIINGASLVQLYTGFIYQGPSIAKNINKGLVTYLQQNHFKNISEAVGSQVS